MHVQHGRGPERGRADGPTCGGRGCYAAARGQAREHVPDRVVRLPLDLVRHELILTHRPPSQQTLEEIVDEIFLPLVLRHP